jgi:hypothetical protein
MAVDNPDVIDLIGTAREDGAVVLTISDHLRWDRRNAHLLALQAKINRYLEFIESGQLAEEYANARPGVPVRIEVACKYPPSPDGEEFLSQVRDTLAETGLGFSWYRLGGRGKRM